MPRLFQFQSRGLAATFADLENLALAQPQAPLGSPGSVLTRTNAGGFRFYALQRYAHDGRRVERYLAGPVGDDAADRAALEARKDIEESREVMGTVRLLLREGYGALSPRPYAVVAALANEGFFRAGGMLAGTHAFEAVANRLGIRGEAFSTEDLDVARPAELAFDAPRPFLEMLARHGIALSEVPAFDAGEPTGKYAARGKSRFMVDLLVPSRGREADVRYVPELKTHAAGLPYFGYLVQASQSTAALSRYGCALVRVPLPERMALHKMLVSQLRPGRSQKSAKDLRQAATLIAALAETHPGALSEAWREMPRSATSHVKAAAKLVAPLLAEHPQGLADLAQLS